MKLFSLDSPVYRFMQRLWDVVKLNFMWILFSLPVVTVGCSTIAAAYVTLRMVDESEGDVVKDFLKGFRTNWKQGIPLSFISVICFLAVYFDFQLYNNLQENSLIFLLMGVFGVYIFTLSLLYVFHLIARYENTLLGSIRNSFRLSMKFFLRTLLLVVILILEFVIWFWNLTTIFVGLLIGPICVIYTTSGTAMYIFKEMEKIPGSVAENSAGENNCDEE